MSLGLWGGGWVPSPEKNGIFTWNSVFWCILSGIFSTSSPEKGWIFAWSSDLVDVEDVLLENSEYSVRVVGLVSFLLHCNASNLVLEIFKHDKIWGGTICISVPSLQILGDSGLIPRVPRGLSPCRYAVRPDHCEMRQRCLLITQWWCCYWASMVRMRRRECQTNKYLLCATKFIGALDVRSTDCGFISYLTQSCITTLGTLFTPMCLCHQAV